MKELSLFLRNHRAFLMGMAMISVMLYHQRWFDGFFFDFFHYVGLLGVDVFLFISGWGIFQSLSKNDLKTYFSNRFWKIIPTCVTIGCLEVALRKLGVESGSDTMMVNILTMMGMFKWYIYAIICYYLCAPLLFRYVTTNNRMLVLVSLIVLASFIVGSMGIESSGKSVFVTTFPIILYRAPGFLLGFWYAMKEDKAPIVFEKISIVAIVLICILFLQGAKLWFTNLILFVLAPFTIPSAIKCLKVILPNLKRCGLYAMISSVGIMSLDYYLWHEYLFIGWSNSGWFDSNFYTCVAALASTIILANLTHYLIIITRKKTLK